MTERARGFTLLEVLVAFAILLLALGVLMPQFALTLDRSARAAEEARATALARDLIDRVGADLTLVDGRLDGAEEGFGWHVAITPWGTDDDRRNWPAAAHLVEVTIDWRAAGRVMSERFRTIRLGPKTPPP